MCIVAIVNNALTLLGLLSREPTHGYDLKQSHDRYFGTGKPLAFGQVYATLARLIRDGLITLVGEEAGGGPDRKRYAITTEGRAHLADWMVTPVVPSQTLQSELFAKTVVALLVDEDADQLLDIQRAAHLERMRELTRLKQAADVLHVLVYDHALFHIEADLRWMDTTSARMAQLRQELLPS